MKKVDANGKLPGTGLSVPTPGTAIVSSASVFTASVTAVSGLESPSNLSTTALKVRAKGKAATVEKRYFKIKDAAEYTGLPVKTLYNLSESRQIPRIKRGRTVLFDRVDLDAFMQAQKEPAINFNNIIANLFALGVKSNDSKKEG